MSGTTTVKVWDRWAMDDGWRSIVILEVDHEGRRYRYLDCYEFGDVHYERLGNLDMLELEVADPSTNMWKMEGEE